VAVVNNTASVIGDTIIVKAEAPLMGLITLNNYTDTLIGETASRFFRKQFSYSLDGINFTPLQELTNANLQAIQVAPQFNFYINYYYTRIGSDPSGLAGFTDVTLNADFAARECGEVYNNSVFSVFFSCSADPVMIWCVNVLEKLYEQGIVPEYITRGGNKNQNEEDRDYIDFWRAITCYYALLVHYARQFEQFSLNTRLLTDYLRNRDMYVCDTQEQVDLVYLEEHFWDEIRHRGTLLITKPKGIDIAGTPKPVDGELLRLLCFSPLCDEFLFTLTEFGKSGWIVNQWSPLWSGVVEQQQLTKGYEKTQDFADLTEYPQVDPTYQSIVTDGSKEVLQITAVPAGQVSGIGVPMAIPADLSKALIVEPKLDYQISFYVRQAPATDILTVKVKAFDIAGNPILLDKINGSGPSDSVFKEVGMNRSDVYYFVQINIYNKDTPDSVDPNIVQTNILQGVNLRLKSNVCKIIPEVILDNTNNVTPSGDMRIWDFKVRPLRLLRREPNPNTQDAILNPIISGAYQMGFLGSRNIVQSWMFNKSGRFDNDQVRAIMIKKLLPYNSFLISNFINN